MNTDFPQRVAKIIIPSLVLGGLAGAGAALGWYPKAFGIVVAVAIAAVDGALVFLLRKQYPRHRA